MAASKITITLGAADGLTIDALTEALEKTLAMLRNVAADFTSADTVIRWEVVKAKMKSPLTMTLEPKFETKVPKSTGPSIILAAIRGVDAIENKSSAPKHFNEAALLAVKDLVRKAEKQGASISLSTSAKNMVLLTNQAVRHVDEVVAKLRKYKDISTIEGSLDVAWKHRHSSFLIWESGTNRRVECLVSEPEFHKYIKYLGKRVAVTGAVLYSNHVPQKIEVESIRILPTKEESPTLEDIGPIDITGGIPSEEYVRRMRDD